MIYAVLTSGKQYGVGLWPLPDNGNRKSRFLRFAAE